MLKTRSKRRPIINRGVIAETGIVPDGLQLLRNTSSLKILDTKKVLVEDINGKQQPVMKVTGLFQESDIENANGRVYPRSILATAIQNILEDVGRRSVYGEYDHPCLCAHDFRVLTIDGWKNFKDIKEGDYVWSRVNETMVKSRVNHIVDEPYDGPAYKIRGKYLDASFTPGHRCLLLKRPDMENNSELYATVEDISKNQRKYAHSPIPRTASWVGNTSPTFTIPASPAKPNELVFETTKFTALLGLYLAEGYIKDNNGIIITQIAEPGRSAVREFLSTSHPELQWSEIKAGFYINDQRLANYLRPLGNKYTKYIPAEIKQLDAPYLEELIHWFAIGDGRILAGGRNKKSKSCKYQNGAVATTERLTTEVYGRMAIFSVSKQLVDDLHECLVKTGRCGRHSTIITEEDYVYADHIIKAENKKPLHQLHISKMTNVYLDPRFTAIEQFHHKGNIYCLSVDHGNFYMEQNGCTFWTGNSDAKIHLDRISHLNTKVWMDGNKIYGEAEILDNQPYGACLRGLFERKCQVGISSRGVGDMELRENNGKQRYYVQEGYSFITWDVVSDPSVCGATLEPVMENLNKATKPLREARRKNLLDQVTYERMLIEEINKFFELKPLS